MLDKPSKAVVATNDVMLKVCYAQLHKLVGGPNPHPKIEAAVGHLEACLAELHDALMETK